MEFDRQRSIRDLEINLYHIYLSIELLIYIYQSINLSSIDTISIHLSISVYQASLARRNDSA